MATGDSQLDSASVTIDGVLYFLKETPSPDSDIVLREKKYLERQVDSQSIVGISEMIAGYVRMARYAVTGNAGLERDVDKRLTDVVLALHESYIDLYDVAGDVFLSLLVDGVVFLFLGEESLAWDRFGKACKNRRRMKDSVALRKDSLRHLSRSCEDTAENIMLTLIASREHAAAETIASAGYAMKCIVTTSRDYGNFWERLWEVFFTLNMLKQCDIFETLEQARKDEESKRRTMKSEAFKRRILTYYAKWVALKDMCTFLHSRWQSMQENVLSSLAARPRSVEKARKELPKMREEMDKMLQKRREEQQKAMQDARDDFANPLF